MNALISWCVNCGKDKLRCKCKAPVISVDAAKFDTNSGALPVHINDRIDIRRYRYGRGK